MAVQSINNSQLPLTGPRQVTIELSSANLLALAATPIQVLPAPGAGYIIKPVGATLFYHAGATPYTTGGAFCLTLGGQLLSALLAADVTLQGAVLAEATDQVGVFDATTAYTDDFAALSALENVALAVINDGAEHTLGNGTATLVVSYETINKT